MDSQIPRNIKSSANLRKSKSKNNLIQKNTSFKKNLNIKINQTQPDNIYNTKYSLNSNKSNYSNQKSKYNININPNANGNKKFKLLEKMSENDFSQLNSFRQSLLKNQPSINRNNELDSKYKIYSGQTPNNYCYSIQKLKANNIKSNINTLDLPFIDNVIMQLNSRYNLNSNSNNNRNSTKQNNNNSCKDTYPSLNSRDFEKYPNLIKSHQNYKFKQLLSDKQQMIDFIKWFEKSYQLIQYKKINEIKKFQQKQIIISSAFNELISQISKISRSRGDILKMLWNKQVTQTQQITTVLTSKVIQLQKKNLHSLSSIHISYQTEIEMLKKENSKIMKQLNQEIFLNKSFINTLRYDRKTLRKMEYFVKKLLDKNQNLRLDNLGLLDENTKMLMNTLMVQEYMSQQKKKTIKQPTNNNLNTSHYTTPSHSNSKINRKTTLAKMTSFENYNQPCQNPPDILPLIQDLRYSESRILLYRRLQISQLKSQILCKKGKIYNKIVKLLKSNKNQNKGQVNNANKIMTLPLDPILIEEKINKQNDNIINNKAHKLINNNKNGRNSKPLTQQQKILFQLEQQLKLKKKSLYQFLLQRFKQYPDQKIFLKQQYLHDYLNNFNQQDQINQQKFFIERMVDQITNSKVIEGLLKCQQYKVKGRVQKVDNVKIIKCGIINQENQGQKEEQKWNNNGNIIETKGKIKSKNKIYFQDSVETTKINQKVVVEIQNDPYHIRIIEIGINTSQKMFKEYLTEQQKKQSQYNYYPNNNSTLNYISSKYKLSSIANLKSKNNLQSIRNINGNNGNNGKYKQQQINNKSKQNIQKNNESCQNNNRNSIQIYSQQEIQNSNQTPLNVIKLSAQRQQKSAIQHSYPSKNQSNHNTNTDIHLKRNRYSLFGIQQSNIIEQMLEKNVQVLKKKARNSLINLKIENMSVFSNFNNKKPLGMKALCNNDGKNEEKAKINGGGNVRFKQELQQTIQVQKQQYKLKNNQHSSQTPYQAQSQKHQHSFPPLRSIQNLLQQQEQKQQKQIYVRSTNKNLTLNNFTRKQFPPLNSKSKLYSFKSTTNINLTLLSKMVSNSQYQKNKLKLLIVKNCENISQKLENVPKNPEKFVNNVLGMTWKKMIKMLKIKNVITKQVKQQQHQSDNIKDIIRQQNQTSSNSTSCFYTTILTCLQTFNPKSNPKSIQSKLLNLSSVIKYYQTLNQIFTLCTLFFGVSNKFKKYNHLIKNDIVEIYFKLFGVLYEQSKEDKQKQKYDSLNETNFDIWSPFTNLQKFKNTQTLIVLQQFFSKMKVMQIYKKVEELIGYVDIENIMEKKFILGTNHQNSKRSKKNSLCVSSFGNMYNNFADPNKAQVTQTTLIPLNSLLLYLIQLYLIQKSTYYQSYHKFIQFFTLNPSKNNIQPCKKYRKSNFLELIQKQKAIYNNKQKNLEISIQQMYVLLTIFGISSLEIQNLQEKYLNLYNNYQSQQKLLINVDIFYCLCILNDLSLLDQKLIQIQCIFKYLPQQFRERFQLNIFNNRNEQISEQNQLDKWYKMQEQFVNKVLRIENKSKKNVNQYQEQQAQQQPQTSNPIITGLLFIINKMNLFIQDKLTQNNNIKNLKQQKQQKQQQNNKIHLFTIIYKFILWYIYGNQMKKLMKINNNNSNNNIQSQINISTNKNIIKEKEKEKERVKVQQKQQQIQKQI